MKELELAAEQLEMSKGDYENNRKKVIGLLRQSIKVKLSKYGFNVDDVFPVKRGKRLPPKFRNPNKPSETWSGYGRKPNWYLEAKSSGATDDAMKI